MSREPFFDDRFLLATGLLTAFFLARAAWDFKKHGAGAAAWKEYAALIVCALAGATFAAALDSVTSRISPEYFSLGKGVPQDSAFALRVAAHGVQSGFAAGAVLGATLLFVSGKNSRTPGPDFKKILSAVGIAMVFAAGFATLAGFLPATLHPLRLDATTAALLGADRAAAFDRVRTVHLGAYLGATTGLIVVAGVARRRTK